MNRFINRIVVFCIAAVMGGAMVACSSDADEPQTARNKARVAFDIRPDAEFATRALDEDSWRNPANYTVEILNAGNEVVGTYKGNALPTELELENGVYTARAYYGEEQAASRTTFLSEGKTEFFLNIGDEQQVKIACAPTCGKVKVNFGEAMATYFNDYYVTLSTPKMAAGTEATWAKADKEPWYLAVGESGDVVTATIHLTPNEKYAADKKKGDDWSEGTVTRTYTLKRNKAWTLNVNPDYTATSGQLGISISIDEGTNEHDIDVVIPAEWE